MHPLTGIAFMFASAVFGFLLPQVFAEASPVLAQAGPVTLDDAFTLEAIKLVREVGGAVGVWFALQFICGVSPAVFDPKPSTRRSRTIKRALALAIGALFGWAGITPAFGADAVAGRIVGGLLAGVVAVVCHTAIGRAVKAGEKRALSKITDKSPGHSEPNADSPPSGDA